MSIADLIVEMEPTQHKELISEQEQSNETLADIDAGFATFLSRFNDIPSAAGFAAAIGGDIQSKLIESTLKDSNIQLHSVVDIMMSIDENLVKFKDFFIKNTEDQETASGFDRMDASEEKKESKMDNNLTPDGYSGKTSKDGDGLFDLLGLRVLLIPVITSFAGLSKVLLKVKGIFKLLPKLIGRLAIPLTAIIGFVEGFISEDTDSLLQKMTRGVLRAMTKVIDYFVMWPLTLVKNIVSWIAKTFFGDDGGKELAAKLDAMDIMSEWTRLSGIVETVLIDLIGSITDKIKELVYAGKKSINASLAIIGLDPIFDLDVTDNIVPGMNEESKKSVNLINEQGKYSSDSAFFNERELTEAIAAGTVHKGSAEKVIKQFENDRLVRANIAIDNIEEEVKADRMSVEAGAMQVSKILAKYPDADGKSWTERYAYGQGESDVLAMGKAMLATPTLSAKELMVADGSAARELTTQNLQDAQYQNDVNKSSAAPVTIVGGNSTSNSTNVANTTVQGGATMLPQDTSDGYMRTRGG